jgi:hypothetical protein
VPIPPSDNFDEALRNLELGAGGAAHDTPVGACWYCRKPIDREREAWKRLPAELLAHEDCDDLWGAMPASVPRRRGECEDDEEYFGELENFVHDLEERKPFDRRYRTKNPKLQPHLDAQLGHWYHEACELLLSPENPWRKPGEADEAYLDRVKRGEGGHQTFAQDDDAADENDDDDDAPESERPESS